MRDRAGLVTLFVLMPFALAGCQWMRAARLPADQPGPREEYWPPDLRGVQTLNTESPKETPPVVTVAEPSSAIAQTNHSQPEASPASEPEPKKAAADLPAVSPLSRAIDCMLAERHQEALKHLQAYEPETQAVFLRILPTLSLFAKKRMADLTTQEIESLTDQLGNLLTSLRPRTDLAVTKICFCDWVKAFGIYKPVSDNHAFLASTGGRSGELVQLYVELRNFTSEPTKEGLFETRLASSVEIRDAKGNLVRAYGFDDNKQPLRSRTRLHDYFNNYSFYLPAECMPGTYYLTLQIVDETNPEARRMVRKTLEFRVTGVAGAH